MDNRPVCIFDSGFGGLTAVRKLRLLMPKEKIIYFADTGRVPYGGRPVEQLKRIAAQDIETVSQYDPKLIIAACGTVSSTAPEVLAQTAKVPVITVLEPSVAALAKIEDDAPIGIIATQASIDSRAYERRLKELCPEKRVVAAACPDFVPLIESGRFNPNDKGVSEAVAKYLEPIKAAGVSALLLGCTHYGLMGRAINEYMGYSARLIEASACAVNAAIEYLAGNDMLGTEGGAKFYTSGPPADFTAMADRFLGRILAEEAEYIPPKEV